MGFQYGKELNDNWKNYEKNKNANIILIGSTGCGKSSLINNIFEADVAQISNVESITTKFDIYRGEKYGIPLNFIDSRGYELSDNVYDYFKNLKNEIDKLNIKGLIVNQVWFCISLAKKRIEDFDISLLEEIISQNLFSKEMCIVITKCDEDTENNDIFKKLEKELRSHSLLEKIMIFEISNDPEIQGDRGKLISWSTKEIGNIELINSFMEREKKKLLLKKLDVEDSLKKYTAMAAGVGITPIPFSDAALLIPIQVTMIGSIIKKYGLKNFATISQAIITDIIIGNLGKSVAGGLLKLIPGVGTIVGGAINAGIASAITYGLGKATSEICYNACLKIVEGKKVDFNEMLNDKELLNSKTKEYLKQYKK